MGLDNIAIVFGPTFLRCPFDDPQQMLLNSSIEKEFVIALIENS